MNRIRMRWLRWRYPEAAALVGRTVRENARRGLERTGPVVDARPAADRFRTAMDAVTEQARQPAPVTDPEDFNDLQAYLEGDARQQDAAALRLDRRAVESGRLSVSRFRETWRDGS